jgi:hypothetical protein
MTKAICIRLSPGARQKLDELQARLTAIQSRCCDAQEAVAKRAGHTMTGKRPVVTLGDVVANALMVLERRLDEIGPNIEGVFDHLADEEK